MALTLLKPWYKISGYATATMPVSAPPMTGRKASLTPAASRRLKDVSDTWEANKRLSHCLATFPSQ